VFGEWQSVVAEEVTQPYFVSLTKYVEAQRSRFTVYPPEELTFSALRLTPPRLTRVVILGQDPYHGAGQAHGLAFSVPSGVALPPSLRNVFAELRSDLGCTPPTSGDLTMWASQGVLLLNTALTVRAGEAGSHTDCGWETFTDRIVSYLGQRDDHCVFILWGRHAARRATHIAPHHTIITSAHPSPLSAHKGFFGSQPFSRANAALMTHDQNSIDWQKSID
jgi:uracil-DNA glycosylase